MVIAYTRGVSLTPQYVLRRERSGFCHFPVSTFLAEVCVRECGARAHPSTCTFDLYAATYSNPLESYNKHCSATLLEAKRAQPKQWIVHSTAPYVRCTTHAPRSNWNFSARTSVRKHMLTCMWQRQSPDICTAWRSFQKLSDRLAVISKVLSDRLDAKVGPSFELLRRAGGAWVGSWTWREQLIALAAQAVC